MDILEAINKRLSRHWTQAPDRASGQMPEYYGNTPRLDSVNVIAKHCASAELLLYSKKDLRKNKEAANPIDEHPLYELLENPCPTFPEIDGWTLRYLTFVYKQLTGECGWLKVRDGKKIIALLPIPKMWIIRTPTVGNHTFMVNPYGETSGVSLTVDPKDFVWFKDINVADPYGRGKGRAESVADEIEADEYASKYQKNFFFNDATPPYVVTGYTGNQQGADQIKKSLMQKIGGFLHAREPAVLTGNVDVKTVGIAPKELDMVESRKFLRDECLQHFQIPPEIMGIIENSNRATIDSSFYLFAKNVVKPELEWFERIVNRQLCPDFDIDLCVKHDFEIAEDEELKLRVYQFGVQNGAITVEQYCEAFGINPDVKDGHYILPMGVNRVPAGEVELPDIFGADDNAENASTENTENVEGAQTEIPTGKNIFSYQRAKQIKYNDFQSKCWNMFDTKATKREPDFIASVKKIATRQAKDISTLLAEYEKENKPVENLIAEYFSKEVDIAVKRSLAGAWIKAMNDGKDNAKNILNKKDFGADSMTNDAFNKWVERYGLLKATEINDTTKKDLLKKLKLILAESIENGDSLSVRVDKLRKGAESVFAELSEARAYLIARTETAGSVNLGQVATYKAYGVQEKQWLATVDNRTRDTHLFMHEVRVPIDMAFDVPRLDGGNDTMQFPADASASAENVCNCRCTITPVIEL